MASLTHKQFDKVARELFGAILSPYGFTCDASAQCTFTRPIGNEVFHVIMPDPGTRRTWYDIHVFPTSPRFHHDFEKRFPDLLGNTLDIWGKLSETAGVGMDQQQYTCRNEFNMRQRFERTVASLLVNTAIPFLDRFQTVNDILPHLRGPFAKFNRK